MTRLALAMLACAAVSGCAHVATHAETAAGRPQLTAAELLDIAHASEQMGDSLRAQQYLLAALERGADERSTVASLLRLYIADNQYPLAIDLVEDRVRRHPEDARLRMLLASLYDAIELDASAMEQYRRVLQITPNEAQAHFALATLLHDTKQDPSSADEHYRAYLALEPHGDDAPEARSLLLKEVP
ncbi:MAG TPA: tetratricopeptide repeat protein [Polyangiales bacterium]|jgi:tetratricopeptide (TPR) repeat protein